MDLGVRENKARQLPPRPRRGRGRGLTCVVPRPPPARPRASERAIPSKAPEISVLSACGNVVWRKVAPRPRAPAPPPPGPPTPLSRALLLSALCMRPPPPPFSDGARGRSPAGANLEQSPGPSGKKLGAIGTGGSIPFSVLEPRSVQGRASGSPGARIKSWPGLERRPRGHGENLPQCLEQRLQRGWRRRTP